MVKVRVEFIVVCWRFRGDHTLVKFCKSTTHFAACCNVVDIVSSVVLFRTLSGCPAIPLVTVILIGFGFTGVGIFPS